MNDLLEEAISLPGWNGVDLAFGPGASRQAREALRDLGPLERLDPHVLQDILIVAGELVANAIDHGSAGALGTMRLSWLLRGSRVYVSVTDAGYDPEFVGTASEAVPPESARGRGLFMVSAISEAWCVRSDLTTHSTTVAAGLSCPRTTETDPAY